MTLARLPLFLIGGLLFIIVTLSGSIFTVDQTSQAIVLQFGEWRKVHTTPGLKFKIPLIQEVTYYDKRVLDYDLPSIHITTGDQKRLVVDTYTRYRIRDPLLFFRTIKPASEIGAQMRLEALISSSVRNVLGKIPLRAMLSADRSGIMHQIEQEVRAMAEPLGIEIVDVRIIRTELPVENRNAVFARMNAELGRFAMENRAKGAEAALGIRAEADKEIVIVLAQAEQQAQVLRGEGEAEATKIAIEAFGSNKELYTFYRTMEIYREAFGTETNLLLSTDHELLSFFNSLPKH